MPFSTLIKHLVTHVHHSLCSKFFFFFSLFLVGEFNCRCDRILWKGEGLKQMWYVRGESRFSDHRPVYSLFSVQVNLATTKSCPRISTNAALSSTCMSKVQAEELLLTAWAAECRICVWNIINCKSYCQQTKLAVS